jgi:hypothetical protein
MTAQWGDKNVADGIRKIFTRLYTYYLCQLSSQPQAADWVAGTKQFKGIDKIYLTNGHRISDYYYYYDYYLKGLL